MYIHMHIFPRLLKWKVQSTKLHGMITKSYKVLHTLREASGLHGSVVLCVWLGFVGLWVWGFAIGGLRLKKKVTVNKNS
jgi:hypothetical protein